MYDSSNNGRVRRRGENVMGKIASAIVAVTLLTSPLLLPVPASAENGQIAAGVVGGLIGGALLGGALSRPRTCAAMARGDIRRQSSASRRSALACQNPLLYTIPSSKISDHIGVPSGHRLDVRLGSCVTSAV